MVAQKLTDIDTLSMSRSSLTGRLRDCQDRLSKTHKHRFHLQGNSSFGKIEDQHKQIYQEVRCHYSRRSNDFVVRFGLIRLDNYSSR